MSGGRLGVSGSGVSGRLGDQLKMLHHRRGGEERPDNGTPFGEQGSLAESDRVVVQRGPVDLQDVALGALDAAIDLVALKTLGPADHRAGAVLDRRFKGGVLTWVDTNVGKFKNH